MLLFWGPPWNQGGVRSHLGTDPYVGQASLPSCHSQGHEYEKLKKSSDFYLSEECFVVQCSYV